MPEYRIIVQTGQLSIKETMHGNRLSLVRIGTRANGVLPARDFPGIRAVFLIYRWRSKRRLSIHNSKLAHQYPALEWSTCTKPFTSAYKLDFGAWRASRVDRLCVLRILLGIE